jgi:hypothetical protein
LVDHATIMPQVGEGPATRSVRPEFNSCGAQAFRAYKNDHRVHRAIAGLTPAQFAGALSPTPAALDHYGWQQHCRGLFELPIAA